MSDPGLYTRDQVIEFMALALRWGYEARVDEENAGWPPPPVFAFGRWYDRALERERADAAVRAEVEAMRGEAA